MKVSNVTIEAVNVSTSDSRAAAGESGIVVVASGASAKLNLKWSYWYDSWFVTVSDEGLASVQVDFSFFITSYMVTTKADLNLSFHNFVVVIITSSHFSKGRN